MNGSILSSLGTIRSTRRTVHIMQVQAHCQMGRGGTCFDLHSLHMFEVRSLLIYVPNGLELVCICYTNLLFERSRDYRLLFPVQNKKLFS
jgi:hypothetical protein